MSAMVRSIKAIRRVAVPTSRLPVMFMTREYTAPPDGQKIRELTYVEVCNSADLCKAPIGGLRIGRGYCASLISHWSVIANGSKPSYTRKTASDLLARSVGYSISLLNCLDEFD